MSNPTKVPEVEFYAIRVAVACLNHPWAQVRCYADWYLEYSGHRSIRGIAVNRMAAARYLRYLRSELKKLEIL